MPSIILPKSGKYSGISKLYFLRFSVSIAESHIGLL